MDYEDYRRRHPRPSWQGLNAYRVESLREAQLEELYDIQAAAQKEGLEVTGSLKKVVSVDVFDRLCQLMNEVISPSD